MIDIGDLPFLAGVLAVAVIVTLGLIILRIFIPNLVVLWVVSGLIFQSLLVGLAFDIANSDLDPHGWLIAFSIMLAFISAPVTLLTGALTSRRLWGRARRSE